jgi:hypothetical protein
MSRSAVVLLTGFVTWLAAIAVQVLHGEIKAGSELLMLGGLGFLLFFSFFGRSIFLQMSHAKREEQEKIRMKFSTRLQSFYPNASENDADLSNKSFHFAYSDTPNTFGFLGVVGCLASVVGVAGGLVQSEQISIAGLTIFTGLCGLIAGLLLGVRS